MLVMVTGPVGRFSGTTGEEVSIRLSNIARTYVAVHKKGHRPLVRVYQVYPMLDFVEGHDRQIGAVAGICLGLAGERGR